MQYTHAVVRPQFRRAYFPREYAPDDSDGYNYAAPPRALRWGEGIYGTYDMAGNVAEWVQDYYSEDGYKRLPAVNPVREVPDDSALGARIVRGGSWAEPKFFSRTYYRLPAAPQDRSSWIGFRCAKRVD